MTIFLTPDMLGWNDCMEDADAAPALAAAAAAAAAIELLRKGCPPKAVFRLEPNDGPV